MSDLPNASSLINRVSTRMRISALARAFYKAFLWVGGIYLVALLVSRLTGVIPHNWFPLESALACLLYTSPSPRDRTRSRMPSSA